MPTECTAASSHSIARELVGGIKARANDQELLGCWSALQPSSGTGKAPMTYRRDENGCTHVCTLC
jgi:hypothetical protein